MLIFGLTLITGLFIAANAEAQTGADRRSMTVEQAVDCALQNSYQLKSGAIDLEIKKRAGNTSWNALLPGVQASGSLSRANAYTDSSGAMMEALAGMVNPLYQSLSASGMFPGLPSSISVPKHQETEEDHWSISAGINFSWNFNAGIIQNIRAAHVDYEAGLLTWEQTQRQVERDVRKMFYSLLLTRENLKIQEASLQNAKNRAEQAEINYRNGRISQLEALRAQVAYENQKPEILRREQSFEQNLSTFAFLLGLPAETKLDLSGSIGAQFVELNSDELMAANLNSRLDLRLLNKNIDQLKLQLSSLNLSAFTPSLSLNYGWQPGTSFPQLSSGAKDPWTDRGSLSITLSWNLTNMLPFSSSRQQAKDLQANIEKQRINAAQLDRQAKMEVKQLIDSLDLSRAMIEASEKSVELADAAYAMAEKAYQSGTTELYDLRDAEASANQAKLAMLNEQFNYVTGLLDLEYALNAKIQRQEKRNTP